MELIPLEEKKIFWLRCFAWECFNEIRYTCDFVLNQSSPLPSRVRKVIISGLIVTYSKAFTNCRGAGCLDKTAIPKEFHALHDRIMDLRHKTIAHIDAENFRADDPRFGNINQIRLVVTKQEYQLHGITISESALPLKELRQAAIKLGTYLQCYPKKA